MKRQPGVLIIENGNEFPGIFFGASERKFLDSRSQGWPTGYGEVVFNTSMTGYQEILTDPSYYGQIICMTHPHIGNTGVNLEDPESKHPWCAGFVIRDLTEIPSNWRSKGGLEAYMKEYGIPGLMDVDTRALTRVLRTTGVVRGLILLESEKSKAQEYFKSLPPFEGRDFISEVSTPKPYTFSQKGKYKVVAFDFGVKTNLLKELADRDCQIEVVPAKTTAAQVLAMKPDGIFLSNGPGDPSAAPYAAECVKELVGKIPLFGVCMGHQILALAMGAKTYKLKFGHRGGNQPVYDKETTKVEISSHNHGYAVDANQLPSNIEITHINLNDRTVEGLKIKGAKAFSVQYHPEACPGPHDSEHLFTRFVEMMK